MARRSGNRRSDANRNKRREIPCYVSPRLGTLTAPAMNPIPELPAWIVWPALIISFVLGHILLGWLIEEFRLNK